MDWQEVRYFDAENYHNFQRDPASVAYPGGESYAQVQARAAAALEELLRVYAGKSLLVVSHHVVNRTYLAGLLGLPLEHARQVALDNCGISVVTRDADGGTQVGTLNASFHLQGVAA
jgi:broad specificity phosphatase PhoE